MPQLISVREAFDGGGMVLKLRSNRERFAEEYVKKTQSVWGVDFVEPLLKAIQATGEAVWDVDEFILDPSDEPQTNPKSAGGDIVESNQITDK